MAKAAQATRRVADSQDEKPASMLWSFQLKKEHVSLLGRMKRLEDSSADAATRLLAVEVIAHRMENLCGLIEGLSARMQSMEQALAASVDRTSERIDRRQQIQTESDTTRIAELETRIGELEKLLEERHSAEILRPPRLSYDLSKVDEQVDCRPLETTLNYQHARHKGFQRQHRQCLRSLAGAVKRTTSEMTTDIEATPSSALRREVNFEGEIPSSPPSIRSTIASCGPKSKRSKTMEGIFTTRKRERQSFSRSIFASHPAPSSSIPRLRDDLEPHEEHTNPAHLLQRYQNAKAARRGTGRLGTGASGYVGTHQVRQVYGQAVVAFGRLSG